MCSEPKPTCSDSFSPNKVGFFEGKFFWGVGEFDSPPSPSPTTAYKIVRVSI